MQLELTVLRRKGSPHPAWERDLRKVLKDWGAECVHAAEIGGEAEVHLGQVLLMDAGISGLKELLESLDRRGRAVVLVVKDAAPLPAELVDGRVDDVLVHPFRLPEILGKFRIYEQLLMQDEVQQINRSFKELIERLREDLKLAERLQKSRFPTRFKDPKGFRVKTRYLAGMKQGGEFFDLTDSVNGEKLSLLLTDSSSYGLSSAVLSVLMRVTAKLTGADARSCFETVQLIYDELMLTLGEKDRLSLFYGMVSRKDLSLKYLNLGSSRAFYAKAGDAFRELGFQGEAISRRAGLPPSKDLELILQPEDRLVLLSDGFLSAVGGAGEAAVLLNRFRSMEPADALNEFVFRVKSKLENEDELPEQDCTGVIMDVDAKFLRIART